MEYFVRTNLNHDGTAYAPGQTVDLPEEVAAGLIKAGVIQTEPIEKVKSPENLQRVVCSPKKKKDEEKANPEQPEASGEKTETGEPSIDGQAGAEKTDAGDITPKMEETDKVDPSAGL